MKSSLPNPPKLGEYPHGAFAFPLSKFNGQWAVVGSPRCPSMGEQLIVGDALGLAKRQWGITREVTKAVQHKGGSDLGPRPATWINKVGSWIREKATSGGNLKCVGHPPRTSFRYLFWSVVDMTPDNYHGGHNWLLGHWMGPADYMESRRHLVYPIVKRRLN